MAVRKLINNDDMNFRNKKIYPEPPYSIYILILSVSIYINRFQDNN